MSLHTSDVPSIEEQAAFYAELERQERLAHARETLDREECPYCGDLCSITTMPGVVILRCRCRY